jgi:hypothetical protein
MDLLCDEEYITIEHSVRPKDKVNYRAVPFTQMKDCL